MKKYLISIVAVSSTLLIPAIFANTTTGTGTTGTGTTGTGTTGTGTTGTGTTGTGTTGTGTTGTGTTGTGTTGTGTTGTGTTGTGTTGTGTNCITATGVTGTGSQNAILLAQQAFSTEIVRLVAEKQAAYSGALALTGSLRIDAMRAANLKFRTGFVVAIQKLNIAKQNNRSRLFEIKSCKKEARKEMKVEKKEHREQIKDLKDKNKEYHDKH